MMSAHDRKQHGVAHAHKTDMLHFIIHHDGCIIHHDGCNVGA